MIHSPAAQLFSRLDQPFTAEALFDQMADIVYFIKGADGCYLCVNQTLVSRCGRSHKSELLGRTPSQVLGERLGKSYESQDHRVLRSGLTLADELELHVYPSGEVGWCLTSKLPLRATGGAIIGLVGVSRDLRTPDTRSEEAAPIAAAVRCARRRLANPPGLRELAAVAGLSIYQLDRRMKRLYGLPTGQWLLKLRISHAGQQLRDSELPIAEIALNAGYADQSAFTRQFRRTTGLTPSEFRRLRADSPEVES